MLLWVSVVAVVLCMSTFLILWMRRRHSRLELERNSIGPEELHSLIESNQKILVFDVRQPLDLLAYSEIIPGSVRIAPNDLLEDASLIVRDEDAVVYCTCPGEKTSRSVIRRALTLGFTRVKFLKGGIFAWKEKGYPVEPYLEPFRLDTAR